MEKAKLNPCPLCGGNDLLADVEFIPKKWAGGINVGFIECLTQYCPMIIRAPTLEEAIEKWNKRTIEDELKATLELEKQENIKIQGDLTYAYKQLAHIRYIFSQMTTSIEMDRMIFGIVKETMERIDGNRRQGTSGS